MTSHNNDPNPLILQLPQALRERLRTRAAAANCPESDLVLEAVAAYLDDAEWSARVDAGLRELDAGQGEDGQDVHRKWRARIAASRAERGR